MGKQKGLYHIIDSMIEGMDHSGQVGGNFRLVMIQGDAKDRLKVLSREPARLAIEIVRASRSGIINKKDGLQYLEKLIDGKSKWDTVEKELFSRCTHPEKLDKLFRGYKIDEEDYAITESVQELYSCVQKAGKVSGKRKKRGQ